MNVYLDNAATTACYPEAARKVEEALLSSYGNPSSMHGKGVEAEGIVREAARTFAGLLKVREKEIYFTSGGTESNNWALLGTARAMARSGRHIITTAVEHPAVTEPLKQLAAEGFDLTVLPVDDSGRLDAAQVIGALREDTILVSVMMVNNEIGSIMPVDRIGEALHREKPDVIFHVDAVQAFGKLPVHPERMHIDLLSVSGHKIHGPKGVGLLYANEHVKIRPLIYGGGQQRGMRSGTDNVPGIAGLAAAAQQICKTMEKNTGQVLLCRSALQSELADIENVRILSPEGEGVCVPHILNVAFPGIRSEVLLHALEDRGIYVSAGSACSSHKRTPSATLTATGCKKEEIESAIRFSFSEQTTEEEIRFTGEALRELVPALRRFVRK